MSSGFIQGLQLRVITGISQFPQSIGRLGPHTRGDIEQEPFPKIRENPTIAQLTQRSQGPLSHNRVRVGQGLPQSRDGLFGFELGKGVNHGTTTASPSDGQRLRQDGNDGWTRADLSQGQRGSLFDGRMVVAQGPGEADGRRVVDVLPDLPQGPGTIFTHVGVGVG